EPPLQMRGGNGHDRWTNQSDTLKEIPVPINKILPSLARKALLREARRGPW
ncbi:hypothetical protein AMECASPLE_005092, partial [Ameca splendens]